MTLFMSQLLENGKPKPDKTRCKKCFRVFRSEKGFNVHKAVHRDKTVTSYHDKENLYKSRKHTGGDKKRVVDYTPHTPDGRFVK